MRAIYTSWINNLSAKSFTGDGSRDVKVSRPAWSRDHIFGLGLIVVGLDLGLMGAGLEVSYRGG